MNKKNLLTGVLALALVGSMTYNAVSASSAGTVSDPLVTKSYVDDKIAQALNAIGGTKPSTGSTLSTEDKNAIINEISAQLKYFANTEIDPITGEQSGDNSFLPVLVPAGSTVFGSEGAEIILRSGTSTAAITAANGISDLTDGIDITNDKAIKANHLLLIPRNDGRGIYANTECWFLIKGEFTIMQK